MGDAFHAIFRSLPPKRHRSKLGPYAALIRGLRMRGRSYREIATILRERCGVTVAVHTLHHFVRARARKQTTAPRPPRSRPVSQGASSAVAMQPLSPDASEDVWRRIAALKHGEAPPAAGEPKAFEYDENEPLQLIAKVKPRKR